MADDSDDGEEMYGWSGTDDAEDPDELEIAIDNSYQILGGYVVMPFPLAFTSSSSRMWFPTKSTPPPHPSQQPSSMQQTCWKCHKALISRAEEKTGKSKHTAWYCPDCKVVRAVTGSSP